MHKKYDVAAFVWPAFTGDEDRIRLFWPEGIGEWETVRDIKPKFEGHQCEGKPVWGYVNEADRYVMEMEINAAADHGVNVFIYDWYWYDNRPFLENCLNDGYLKARNNDRVKFYLMWANHDIGYTWDIRNSDMEGNYTLEQLGKSMLWSGGADRAKFETVTDRIIEKYFNHPSYYCIDGKPVFMIFSLPVLVAGLGGLKATREALMSFREKCEKAGLGGLHLQLNLHKVCYEIEDEGRIVPIREIIDYLGFDSATNYQMLNLVEPKSREYTDAVEEAVANWEVKDSEIQIPYYPQVGVGWDNNARFKSLKEPIFYNATPEAFEEALRAAKAFLDKRPDSVPLVTVNSWNEWTEGSYLQPDTVYGYKRLEAIKNVFGKQVD